MDEMTMGSSSVLVWLVIVSKPLPDGRLYTAASQASWLTTCVVFNTRSISCGWQD